NFISANEVNKPSVQCRISKCNRKSSKKVSAANFKIPKRKARAQYTFVRMFAKLELRLKNAFMDKVFFLLLKQPMDQFD
ncbi:hypothetical protein, partial [Legionella pneumophila]